MRKNKIIPVLTAAVIIAGLFAGCKSATETFTPNASDNTESIESGTEPLTPDISDNIKPIAPLLPDVQRTLQCDYWRYVNGSNASIHYPSIKNIITVMGYFGTYDNREVVLMAGYGSELKPTEGKEFEVAGFEIELSSGAYNLLLHTGREEFLTLTEAYELGYLDENDIEKIQFNINTYRGRERETVAQVPAPAPLLPPDVKAKINGDYKEWFKSASSYTDNYVSEYFGTYNGGEVLLMCPSESITHDSQYLHIGGYVFHFGSGTYQFLYHVNSTFMSVSDAYLLGYLSEDDLLEIFIRHINY